jgi:hypothetical protein
LAFALRSRNDGRIVGGADNGLAAVIGLRRDPAQRQGHVGLPGGDILLNLCEPAENALRSAAGRADHMIAGPLPQSLEQIAP